MAAMPSPRPVNPIWSVVVAVTDTGQPTAADRAASASARRVPIFGRLPMIATEADAGVYPLDARCATTSCNISMPCIPAPCASAPTPNSEPMSPKRAAQATRQSERARPHRHRNRLRSPRIWRHRPRCMNQTPASRARQSTVHGLSRQAQNGERQNPALSTLLQTPCSPLRWRCPDERQQTIMNHEAPAYRIRTRPGPQQSNHFFLDFFSASTRAKVSAAASSGSAV